MIMRDNLNVINTAREEGQKFKEIEIARNLFDVLDAETISLKTGVTINKVKSLAR